MAFGTSINSSSINENWLFKLANHNSGYLYLAFSDVTYNSNFYTGAITNRPNIKESINLMTSQATTSGISITIADFDYQGSPVSKELLGGSNIYINRDCTVHSLINGDTPNQIASFRVVELQTNGVTITIKMNSHRPWDHIKIPNIKTTERNLFVPVAYGDYTKNPASTEASPQFISDLDSYAYREVEYNISSDGLALYPNTNNASSSDGELAVYNDQYNVFIPCNNAVATTTNTDNADHGRVDINAHNIYKVSANTLTQDTLASTLNGNSATLGVTVSNLTNAYNNNTSTYATFSATSLVGDQLGSHMASYIVKLDEIQKNRKWKKFQKSDGDEILLASTLSTGTTQFDIDSTTGLFVGSVLKIKEEIMVVTEVVDSNTITVLRAQLNTTAIAHDNDTNIYFTLDYNLLTLTWEAIISHADSGSGTQSYLRIIVGANGEYLDSGNLFANTSKTTTKIPLPDQEEVYLGMFWIQNNTDGAAGSRLSGYFRVYDIGVTSSRSYMDPKKKMYIANDGLTHGITGLSGNAITSINNIHLDLLNRFTGLDVATNPATNIDGWSDLETDRSDWKARVNVAKETDLKKVLDKLQFEGAFIFRYKQGDVSQPQYIHVKDSYSSGTTQLSKNDISNIKISHVSFSNMATHFNVNYRKHPAEDDYLATETYQDNTFRSNYNVATKENIVTYNLDYLVEQNDVEEQSNPNDSFINYYYNLFGTPKLSIDFNLVNSKYYALEIGSVIYFDSSNMFPNYAFGNSWGSGTLFMITSTSRTLGKVSVTAKEV